MVTEDAAQHPDTPEVPSEIAPGAPVAPTAVKRPRWPLERAIVWGGISVLLVVLWIEFRATRALASDRDAVLAALDQSRNAVVTESEVQKLVTRYSRRESQAGLLANELAASRVDTYTYRGLLKKRVLYIYFGLPRAGHEQEVLQVTETPVKVYTPEDFGFQRDGQPQSAEPDE